MRKRRSFEAQLTSLSLNSSVPLLLLLIWVMIYADISVWLVLLAGLIGAMVVIYANYRIHQKLVYQFRSLNSLLDALTQGDYSQRARPDQSGGEKDELVASINGLAWRLSQQRAESVENQLLLNTVIEHIDVAIVALTEESQIGFLNPAAKRLLQFDQVGSNAEVLEQLDFVQTLSSGCNQVIELSLGSQQGRFNVHVEEFRDSGVQSKLLFITDVRTLLRSEERKAWQSLVRVISHEINNSLSPIASISQTLKRYIERRKKSDDEDNKDIVEGLATISERANGLRLFVDSYRQLAEFPEPKQELVSIAKLFEKISILFKHQSIEIESNTDVQLFIDPVQFEQVLINLIKNAAEAMSQTNPHGVIRVGWNVEKPFFKLSICDQGGGLRNPDNLFVPFYSTKKNGSGIGLVLCRQIVEAHNGRLSINNLKDDAGCCASIELPFSDRQNVSGLIER